MASSAKKSLTRDQVRQADRYAILTLGIPGAILMENAGRNATDAIVEFVRDQLSPADSPRIAIVAGAGNNGGDGFVIARHLMLRKFRPEIFLVADEAKVKGDAKLNLDIARSLGIVIDNFFVADRISTLAGELKNFDLIVDALGGTGISGPLRGDTASAVEQMNLAGPAIVAVDIPTGLDCDTGLPLGQAVCAAMTVTFVARKVGFDSPSAEKYTGRVVVADIGVPVDLICSSNAD